MNTTESMRRPGGGSRSVDYLRSSLINPDPADDTAKLAAIVNLSELVNVAIDQTAVGDPDCGYLVAELLAYLSKKRASLGEKNENFRKCCLKWESSRVATARGSPLRPLIHAILAEARREKRFQEVAKLMPDSELVVKRVCYDVDILAGGLSPVRLAVLLLRGKQFTQIRIPQKAAL